MRPPFHIRPLEAHYSENGTSMKFHSHTHFELYYFHGGKANYLIGDKIFVLSPGDLILMHGMTLHCPNVDTSVPYRRTIVHFDPAFIKPFTEAPFAINVLQPFYEMKNVRLHLEGTARIEVEAMLEKMCRLSFEDGALSRDRLIVAFLDLMLLVYERCQSSDAPPVFPSDKERHAQNIIDFVEEHYHEDLHLEQLEERLHLNKYYLSKLFKEVTGATIFDYVYHRRINQSKIHFVLDRDMSVTDVCYKVGFKHPSHFTRMFKSRVGCTPEQFRKQAAFT
ncbi:helix-turn-helix transcriptional regulator [Paenibacillus sp. GYB003]|uniref:helix-turn-helix transcriptional regulator n=1 Tax=Paenibacillus sp. GYB003 TaxID=2994392 RepID=UPI002F961B40